ncbi:hypothetical protein DL768_005433 [Monosporascus sp. mg162]|nr:hypothetical protein DL768_005433 [Monosporascus sp. mg162]
MPGKHQKDASKPYHRNPRRGSSSAGPRQPDHAPRYGGSHLPTIDGCDSESEIDGEVNPYNGTTPPISSSGGYENNVGVVSHFGTYSSGSTLHSSPSNQRNDCSLPHDTSSGNTSSAPWSSSTIDGAVNYADPSSTVGRETAPTHPSPWTTASRPDDQYASLGAQDLRANYRSSEAGSYSVDAYGYPVPRDVRYCSPRSYVENKDPVSRDAIAGVDTNQPAQTTAGHSPPSSVDANNGSAQASPVMQQHSVFESPQRRTPAGGRLLLSAADEAPWNPHDAVQKYNNE